MTNPTDTSPSELFTPFLPTTYNIPEHDDRLDTFLNETFANFADVINDKTIGAYTESTENFNGQKWIYISPKIVRTGYQAITYVPSFTAGTFSIPMPVPNVNPQFIITHCWGSASKPCSATGAGDGDYFSFLSQGNTNISFTMSDTLITFTVSGLTGTYSGFIVVEYVRNGF